jgi:hypothetical protein
MTRKAKAREEWGGRERVAEAGAVQHKRQGCCRLGGERHEQGASHDRRGTEQRTEVELRSFQVLQQFCHHSQVTSVAVEAADE